MGMFEGDELQTPDLQLAPGPAAYSGNGNGPDADLADDIGEAPADDTLAWIATAPPMAVLAIAATGAALALLFLAIGKVIRGTAGN